MKLRPVEPDDVAVFFEHQQDPLAREMAVFGARDRQAHDEHWRRILADPDVIARTIVVEETVAGNIGSWSSDGQRYVGYWIGREFWGRGVATQAVRALAEEINERPLVALVATTNVGSCRVLEKNGFTRVARRPSREDGVEEFVYRLN